MTTDNLNSARGILWAITACMGIWSALIIIVWLV